MIFDLHNDVLTSTLDDSNLKQYLNDLEESLQITLAIWTSKLDNPFSEITKLTSKTKRLSNSKKEIFFAIEDLHFLNSKNLPEFEKSIQSSKILYSSLSWNNSNPLAGGALSDEGLTDEGKKVIDFLQQKKISVDMAHLNKKSFFDVIKYTKKPVINSHCCFDALCSNPRNINDEQIYAIIETNGIIGLSAVPQFLTKNTATIFDLFLHIDYFINKFGYKNLAIGSDFYGIIDYPIGLKNYHDFIDLQGIMKHHGYNQEVIESIFFKNAQNFFGL